MPSSVVPSLFIQCNVVCRALGQHVGLETMDAFARFHDALSAWLGVEPGDVDPVPAWTRAVAATGHLWLIKYIFKPYADERDFDPDWVAAMDGAAGAGHAHVLRWIQEPQQFGWAMDRVPAAGLIRNGDVDFIETWKGDHDPAERDWLICYEAIVQHKPDLVERYRGIMGDLIYFYYGRYDWRDVDVPEEHRSLYVTGKLQASIIPTDEEMMTFAIVHRACDHLKTALLNNRLDAVRFWADRLPNPPVFDYEPYLYMTSKEAFHELERVIPVTTLSETTRVRIFSRALSHNLPVNYVYLQFLYTVLQPPITQDFIRCALFHTDGRVLKWMLQLAPLSEHAVSIQSEHWGVHQLTNGKLRLLAEHGSRVTLDDEAWATVCRTRLNLYRPRMYRRLLAMNESGPRPGTY